MILITKAQSLWCHPRLLSFCHPSHIKFWWLNLQNIIRTQPSLTTCAAVTLAYTAVLSLDFHKLHTHVPS